MASASSRPAVLSYQWFKQSSFIQFGLVGLVSTAIDTGILELLYPRVLDNVYLATALGFFAGLTVGFLLNSQYVFQKDRTLNRYVKYGLISLGGLLLTELIVHILYVDLAVTTPLKAKLVAVVLVFFWNYTWSKLWAFK
jgi:putative flippase GtrA